MKKVQHEKIEVENPCLKLCAVLESKGVILEYRKLDARDKRHIKGSPDIEIKYVSDNILHLLHCECKRPNGGRWETHQQEYKKKYQHCANVDYYIVRSREHLEDIIEKLTGYQVSEKKRLDDIEYNP